MKVKYIQGCRYDYSIEEHYLKHSLGKGKDIDIFLLIDDDKKEFLKILNHNQKLLSNYKNGYDKKTYAETLFEIKIIKEILADYQNEEEWKDMINDLVPRFE